MAIDRTKQAKKQTRARQQGRSRPTQGIRRRQRRPRRDTGADVPLRLLLARLRPMSRAQEQRLIVSLGELIVEVIEADPGGLDGLRTRPRSGSRWMPRAKEQP
jgi:hypothetical protein